MDEKNTLSSAHKLVSALSGKDGVIDARIDTDREARCGFPEVVFAEFKTAEQVLRIALEIFKKSGAVLSTRIGDEQAAAVIKGFEQAQESGEIGEFESKYHSQARLLYIKDVSRPALDLVGLVVVVSAGTSDFPVAEEAALSAEYMGARVERLYDAGVAGVHRALEHTPLLQKARVVIAVAGMEGALPSLVAGLVKVPVVAVPTSVGYGAAFDGLTPLFAMLTSCAGGIGVVNIDNGFGAAVLATRINNPQHNQ